MNVILLHLFSLEFSLSSPEPIKKEVKGNLQPFLFLELFNSKGCSSCPSTDVLSNSVVSFKQTE